MSAALYKFKPMLGPAEEWPVGSVEWAERMANRLQVRVQSLSRDTAHMLLDHLRETWAAKPRPWDIWPVGRPFGTPEDYFRNVTGHSWASLLQTVAELTGEAGLSVEMMQAENARAQVEHRGPGRPPAEKPCASHDLKQGTGHAAYTLRRLARERPDVLSRYEAGEFKSVRAAAREAGLVKTLTPFELACKIVPKLTPGERQKLKEMLQQLDP
jgi:hypothetical protein